MKIGSYLRDTQHKMTSYCQSSEKYCLDLQTHEEYLLRAYIQFVNTLQIYQGQIKLYLDISRKKEGIALSLVKDDFCAMCHMRILPQIFENSLFYCDFV